MIRRKDAVAILLALALAGALFGARALFLGQGSAVRQARVYVNGAPYQTVALGEEREIVIEQADGSRNVIEVGRDGFRMRESTCRNQLCVRQGEVTVSNYASRALGTHVICLPNRVDVELVLTEEDDVSDAPDA